MEEHTTILIGKKTRCRLAGLKRYRRESYDEALGRLFAAHTPDASTSFESERVREALERLERFWDGPKKTDKEIEEDMRRVEEMEAAEAREFYAQLHPPRCQGSENRPA